MLTVSVFVPPEASGTVRSMLKGVPSRSACRHHNWCCECPEMLLWADHPGFLLVGGSKMGANCTMKCCVEMSECCVALTPSTQLVKGGIGRHTFQSRSTKAPIGCQYLVAVLQMPPHAA